MIVRRIVSNATFLILGKLLSGALNIVTLAMIARNLGVAEYGTYSFCFAYFLIVQIISTFGVDSILVREIARDSRQTAHLLGQGMLIKTIMAIVGYALATTTIRLLDGSPQNVKLLHIFSISLLAGVFGTSRVLYEARLRSVVPSVIELLGKILFLSLVMLGAHQEYGPEVFAWFYVASEFFGAVCLFLVACRHTTPMIRLEINVFRRILGECWPVALTSIFVVIYFRVDTLLLKYFRGSVDVGYYSSAYFVLAGLMFLPEAFSKSVFPIMAEIFDTASHSLAGIFHRASKYMLTLCLPVGLSGFMLSDDIIGFMYGADYIPASGALKILSLAIVVMFLGYITTTTLVAINRQRDVMWVALVNAIVNVVLNFVSIPRWGFFAASFTTVITEALGFVVTYYLVLHRLGLRKHLQSVWRCFPLLSALCVQFLILRAGQENSFFLVLPLSLVAYILTLIALRWLDDTDWSILQEIMQWSVPHQ